MSNDDSKLSDLHIVVLILAGIGISVMIIDYIFHIAANHITIVVR